VPIVRAVAVGPTARGRHRSRGYRRGRRDCGRPHRATRGPGACRCRSAAAPHADATASRPGASVGGSVLGLWCPASCWRPLLHDLRDDGGRLTGIGSPMPAG
jgi:hypothetical protein